MPPPSFTPQLLLQRQLEASGSFREPVRNAQQLTDARLIVAELAVFMPTVEELSLVLKIPLENVFQCLMQIGLGSSVGFDQQARKGAVPMHQAKVLDRNAQLAAQQVEPTLRKQVPEDALEKLVENSQTLRNFLRMKVEDNNDFKMAHQMVRLTHEYLSEIHRLSDGDARLAFQLFNAQTEDELVSLSRGLIGTASGGGVGSDSPSKAAPSGASGGGVTKPLPKNLVAGITNEAAAMATGKEPVAQRQAALGVIYDWLQRADQAVLDGMYEEVVAALAPPIKLHLGEKRSAIMRLVTAIITLLAVRSPPALLMDGPHQSHKVRTAMGQWLDALFKSVFVTVSAIANAADEAVRDVVVASAGASFTLNSIAACLKGASQTELKRKLVNYVTVALLSTRPKGFAHTESEYLALSTLLSTQVVSNDATVRKAARTALLLATSPFGEGLPPSVIAKFMAALSDPQVSRAVGSGEREAVMAAAQQGIEALELQWFGCTQPCTASLFWHERCNIPQGHVTLASSDSPVAAVVRSPTKARKISSVPSTTTTSKDDGAARDASTAVLSATGSSAREGSTSSSQTVRTSRGGVDAMLMASGSSNSVRVARESAHEDDDQGAPPSHHQQRKPSTLLLRRSPSVPLPDDATTVLSSSASGSRQPSIGMSTGSSALASEPPRKVLASSSKVNTPSPLPSFAHPQAGNGPQPPRASGLLPSIYAKPSAAVGAVGAQPKRVTTPAIAGAMPLSLSFGRGDKVL